MAKTILIVDDDADILKLLEMRLIASGYQVFTATSAAEALTLFHVKPVALIISDLRMPEMDGFALFEAMHHINATVPFILLTAHGSIPEAVLATQKGMFSFLTKPFDSKTLLELIASALKMPSQISAELPNQTIETWRESIISCSPQMESLLSQAKLIAETDASVLILGESGTGKEMFAQAIHRASKRSTQPFVAINCAALPEALLESELFGHVKGAFTGATRDHPGLFIHANGGTLFLDEIGDMPISIQAKLLRALQARVIRPVGANQDIAFDVRLICATHKNLNLEMRENRFREDLYYRINVVSLEIPPLYARREDIGLLASYFLAQLNQKYHKKINGFAPDALENMLAATWPGNVRQLQNTVEQVVVLSTTSLISANLVHKAMRDNVTEMLSYESARKQFEQQYLINILKATQGNVAQAARMAVRNRTDFYKLLQRNQINPALFKPVKLVD